MSEAGFDWNVTQIQAKLKNLKHMYHRTKDAVNKSGASMDVAIRICPQFEQTNKYPTIFILVYFTSKPEIWLDPEILQGRLLFMFGILNTTQS